MSGSKAKKTCKFVYKRGAKEGQKCGRACVSTFCFAHNKKNLEYKKKYNGKTSKDKKSKKIKEKIDRLFKIKDIANLPNLDNLKIKNLNIMSEVNRLIKIKLGQMQILQEDNEGIKKEFNKLIDILENKLKNKYPCTGSGEVIKKWTDKNGHKCKTSSICDCDNCIDYRHKSNQPLFFPYTDKLTLLGAKYKKNNKKIKELKEKREFVSEQIKAIEQIIEDKEEVEI